MEITPFISVCSIICFCLQVNFQHWKEGEPNNKNNVEACAEFSLYEQTWSGSWNDVQCEKYNKWLCQIRAGKEWSFGYMDSKEKCVILLWHLLRIEWARLLFSALSFSQVFRCMQLILYSETYLSMFIQEQLQSHLQSLSLLVSEPLWMQPHRNMLSFFCFIIWIQSVNFMSFSAQKEI